jgi:hypothetical protein
MKAAALDGLNLGLVIVGVDDLLDFCGGNLPGAMNFH